MSIAHELSSDITTALVDTLKDEGSTDPKKVAEIVLDFHSALRPLDNAEQTYRTRRKAKVTELAANSSRKGIKPDAV